MDARNICYTCRQRETDVKCDKCPLVRYCSTKCAEADKQRHNRECEAYQFATTCHRCSKTELKDPVFKCKYCNYAYYCSKRCRRQHSDHSKSCLQHRNAVRNLVYPIIYTYNLADIETFPLYCGRNLAVDILQLKHREGVNPERDLNILVSGTGDWKDVVHTVASLPEQFQNELIITVHDEGIHVSARNLLLLTLCNNYFFDPRCVVQIWYSFLLTEDVLQMLSKHLQYLMTVSWDTFLTTINIMTITESNWEKCRPIWKAWYLFCFDEKNQKRVALQRQKKLEMTKDEGFEWKVNHFLRKDLRPAFLQWHRNGVFSPMSEDITTAVRVNPTMTCLNPSNPCMMINYPELGGEKDQLCHIYPETHPDDMCVVSHSHYNPFCSWDMSQVVTSANRGDTLDACINYVAQQLQKFSYNLLNKTIFLNFTMTGMDGLVNELKSLSYDRIISGLSNDKYILPTLIHQLGQLLNRENKHSMLITRHGKWFNDSNLHTYQKERDQHFHSKLKKDVKCRPDAFAHYEMKDMYKNLAVAYEQGCCDDYIPFHQYFYRYLQAEIIVSHYRYYKKKKPQSYPPDVFYYYKNTYGLQLFDFLRYSNSFVPMYHESNLHPLNSCRVNCLTLEWIVSPTTETSTTVHLSSKSLKKPVDIQVTGHTSIQPPLNTKLHLNPDETIAIDSLVSLQNTSTKEVLNLDSGQEEVKKLQIQKSRKMSNSIREEDNLATSREDHQNAKMPSPKRTTKKQGRVARAIPRSFQCDVDVSPRSSRLPNLHEMEAKKIKEKLASVMHNFRHLEEQYCTTKWQKVILDVQMLDPAEEVSDSDDETKPVDIPEQFDITEPPCDKNLEELLKKRVDRGNYALFFPDETAHSYLIHRFLMSENYLADCWAYLKKNQIHLKPTNQIDQILAAAALQPEPPSSLSKVDSICETQENTEIAAVDSTTGTEIQKLKSPGKITGHVAFTRSSEIDENFLKCQSAPEKLPSIKEVHGANPNVESDIRSLIQELTVALAEKFKIAEKRIKSRNKSELPIAEQSSETEQKIPMKTEISEHSERSLTKIEELLLMTAIDPACSSKDTQSILKAQPITTASPKKSKLHEKKSGSSSKSACPIDKQLFSASESRPENPISDILAVSTEKSSSEIEVVSLNKKDDPLCSPMKALKFQSTATSPEKPESPVKRTTPFSESQRNSPNTQYQIQRKTEPPTTTSPEKTESPGERTGIPSEHSNKKRLSPETKVKTPTKNEIFKVSAERSPATEAVPLNEIIDSLCSPVKKLKIQTPATSEKLESSVKKTVSLSESQYLLKNLSSQRSEQIASKSEVLEMNKQFTSKTSPSLDREDSTKTISSMPDKLTSPRKQESSETINIATQVTPVDSFQQSDESFNLSDNEEDSVTLVHKSTEAEHNQLDISGGDASQTETPKSSTSTMTSSEDVTENPMSHKLSDVDEHVEAVQPIAENNESPLDTFVPRLDLSFVSDNCDNIEKQPLASASSRSEMLQSDRNRQETLSKYTLVVPPLSPRHRKKPNSEPFTVPRLELSPESDDWSITVKTQLQDNAVIKPKISQLDRKQSRNLPKQAKVTQPPIDTKNPIKRTSEPFSTRQVFLAKSKVGPSPTKKLKTVPNNEHSFGLSGNISVSPGGFQAPLARVKMASGETLIKTSTPLLRKIPNVTALKRPAIAMPVIIPNLHRNKLQDSLQQNVPLSQTQNPHQSRQPFRLPPKSDLMTAKTTSDTTRKQSLFSSLVSRNRSEVKSASTKNTARDQPSSIKSSKEKSSKNTSTNSTITNTGIRTKTLIKQSTSAGPNQKSVANRQTLVSKPLATSTQSSRLSGPSKTRDEKLKAAQLSRRSSLPTLSLPSIKAGSLSRQKTFAFSERMPPKTKSNSSLTEEEESPEDVFIRNENKQDE